MNIFADGIASVRYGNGLVAIHFAASGSETPGVEIHMPVSSFLEMIKLLERKAPQMAQAHRNWATTEAEELTMPQTEVELKNEKVGKRLASV